MVEGKREPQPVAVLRYIEECQRKGIKYRTSLKAYRDAGGKMYNGKFHDLWDASLQNPLRFRGTE